MTVDDLLRQGRLEPLEARILIGHALQWTRVQLVTRSQDALNDSQINAIETLFSRRLAGEPIAYLVGVREFYGLDFEVSPAVLIPRPETELLVELATAHLPRQGKVLDLGTGSGAIAVSVAHLRPDAQVTATDISADALDIAQRNAKRHGTNIQFLLSDWYEQAEHQFAGNFFDLIISNPPYIAAGDPHLSEGDLRFEPVTALTDRADGLQAIEKIITGAPAHLKAGGWLLIEHGYDQSEAVRTLLQQQGWSEAQSWRDLAGIERVSGARLTASFNSSR